MKVTKLVVNEFEQDQKENGTQTAIHNLLWTLASEMFKDLGAKRVQTTYHKQPLGALGADNH